MEQRWLFSALAAFALSAGPAIADGAAPTEKPAGPPLLLSQTSLMPLFAQNTGAEEAPPPPKFTWGAWADFYYSSNLNDPWTGQNALRAFDYKDEQGPHIGMMEVWAQYARDPFGFRVDLNFGPTAHLFHLAEPGGGHVWKHIQQAYVSANLTRDGRTYIDLGKWVSPVGYEVPEVKDNNLHSIGLLYNLAQPFYHLGGRLYHYFNDTDYVMVHVNRGWNAVGDPDHGPGFGITYSRVLSPTWTLTANYIGGEELPVATEGEAWRNIFDVVLLYKPNARWSFAGNFDVVTQSDANVWGGALHARYNLNPRSYLAARGEFVVDDGFVGTDAYSFTVGYGYTWNKYLQTRAEFRNDWASQDVFADSRFARFTDTQPTFLISAILNLK